jgi:hypothetical protein
MENEDRSADALHEQVQRRGYTYRAWEYAARKAPQFMGAYDRLADNPLLHEPDSVAAAVLPPKWSYAALAALPLFSWDPPRRPSEERSSARRPVQEVLDASR